MIRRWQCPECDVWRDEASVMQYHFLRTHRRAITPYYEGLMDSCPWCKASYGEMTYAKDTVRRELFASHLARCPKYLLALVVRK